MDARTKVDCFTQDALEQIKGVVNGNEPTYVNRGGVGKDVRYLSDFALWQIKNAVGTNGGGQGGDVVEIKKMWSLSGDEQNPTFTEIEKTESQFGIYYQITHGVSDIAYIATDDNNTPNIQTMANVVLYCTPSIYSVAYLKNIGAHQQYWNNEGSGGIGVNIFNSFDKPPYMEIQIDYTSAN